MSLKTIKQIIFLSVAGFFCSVHAGWISPSGLGATNGWTNGNNAIDGNTGTYASHGAETGWGEFIEFTTGAIYCDRIRVYADFGYNQVDSVEVNAYNGSWNQVFVGTVNDAVWTDLPFTALANVTMGSFRFHWKTGSSLTFWLYEFEFWSGTPSVAPTLTTTGATSVNLTSAIMHGSCSSDGGSIGQFRFKYGLTTSYTDSTAWSGSIMAGQTFGTGVTGLASGTLYHYRAQLKNGAGTGSGGDRTFSTGAPSAGWISPTGYSDPAARWSNEAGAYDDETGTYAGYSHQTGETNWIEYLYLLFPSSFSSDSVRFYASSNARIDSIDIDSYDGAVWTDAYAGTFADQTWVTQYFSSRTVAQIRVRFRAVNTGEGFPMELFELDCYKQDANAPTLAWTGETNYASDGLDPETGYSDTDFKYRGLYTDADNDGPAVIQVWIDRNGDGDYTDANEKVTLSVASDAAAAQRDGGYANGEIFSVTTEISYLAATAYSYRFFANDGILDATGTPNTVINNKPVISAYPLGVTPVWSKSGIGQVNGGAATDNAMYVGTGGAGTQYLYKFNSSDGTAAWPGSGSYSTVAWGDCRMPTYMYSDAISKYKVLFSAGTYVVGYQDDGASATQLFARDVGSTSGTPYSNPYDSSFYVAYLNTISKRSMSDGSVLFNINATNVSTSADIVVVNDYVYGASTDGRIYSADAGDGTPLNVYSGMGGAAVNLPLMLIGDTLYVTPDDHKMYAVRIPLLSAVANFPVTITGQNSGAMYRDSLKIYCASGTAVQCFPISGGPADWTRDIGDIIQSGPIPYNNIVYVGRNNGRYYALDAATGAIKSNWPYTSASGDATTGPWIDITNSHVIFGTTGGNLDAFNSP